MHVQFLERNILRSFFNDRLICTFRMQNILEVLLKVTNIACSKFSITLSILDFVYTYKGTFKVTSYFLMDHCPLNLLQYMQKSFKTILKLQILFKNNKQFKLISVLLSVCYGSLYLQDWGFFGVFFNLLYLRVRAAYQSVHTYFPKAGKCKMN